MNTDSARSGREGQPATLAAPILRAEPRVAGAERSGTLGEDNQSTMTAAVRVGRGLRPITQHGRLEITADRLKLEDARGRLIAEAPLGRVSVRRLRRGAQGLALSVDGVKYNIDSAPGPGLARIRATKRLIEDVLEFVTSHGGTLG